MEIHPPKLRENQDFNAYQQNFYTRPIFLFLLVFSEIPNQRFNFSKM